MGAPRRRSVGLVAVVLLPYLVNAVLVVVHRHWAATPADDLALTELSVRHAAHFGQLLGPYSRYGWHHPGPLMFYVLAPFYLVAGARQTGLYLGALAVNSACVVAVWWLLRRKVGERRALVVAAVLAGLVMVAGAHFSAYPWNPTLVVAPLILFVVAGALAVDSMPWALVVAVAASSFVVQSDVGPGLAVAAMAAVVAVGFVVRWRLTRPRPLIASGALLALLWVPVVVEQLVHDPGNAGRLLRFFVSGGTGQGRRAATALFTYGLTIFPLGRDGNLSELHQSPGLVRAMVAIGFLLALAACAVLGLRRRSTGGWLSLVALVGAAAALPSTFAVRDQPIGYLVYWAVGLAVAGWIGIVLTVSERLGPVRRPVVALAAALLVVATVGAVWVTAEGSTRSPWIFDGGGQNAGVAAGTSKFLRAHHRLRPLVTLDQASWPAAAALVDDLDRAGFDVTVERSWLFMYDPRFAGHGRSDVTLHVAVDGAASPGRVVVDRGGTVVTAVLHPAR